MGGPRKRWGKGGGNPMEWLRSAESLLGAASHIQILCPHGNHWGLESPYHHQAAYVLLCA